MPLTDEDLDLPMRDPPMRVHHARWHLPDVLKGGNPHPTDYAGREVLLRRVRVAEFYRIAQEEPQEVGAGRPPSGPCEDS